MIQWRKPACPYVRFCYFCDDFMYSFLVVVVVVFRFYYYLYFILTGFWNLFLIPLKVSMNEQTTEKRLKYMNERIFCVVCRSMPLPYIKYKHTHTHTHSLCVSVRAAWEISDECEIFSFYADVYKVKNGWGYVVLVHLISRSLWMDTRMYESSCTEGKILFCFILYLGKIQNLPHDTIHKILLSKVCKLMCVSNVQLKLLSISFKYDRIHKMKNKFTSRQIFLWFK